MGETQNAKSAHLLHAFENVRYSLLVQPRLCENSLAALPVRFILQRVPPSRATESISRVPWLGAL
jgi:hypothetical protein